MNKYTFPILAQLADGKFHSGEVLAQQLGVSRATVFNAVQTLSDLGLTIFSVRGRGYRLSEAMVMLTIPAIEAAIGHTAERFTIRVLPEVDSTNRFLMQESALGIAHATCVVAMMQTAGRGRRGRQWLSQLGSSLTFSLLWRFSCGAAGLSGLSLVVGLALVEALHACGYAAVQLKWPNDLLVYSQGQWHKLGGILIELQGDMEGPSAAVIGVGLNLKLDHTQRAAIGQPSIGLQQLLGHAVDPNLVLGRCLARLGERLPQFAAHGFAPFKAAWLAQHAFHQQAVYLHFNHGQTLQGVAVDVHTDGSLVVETDQGRQTFHAGEISLRSAT